MGGSVYGLLAVIAVVFLMKRLGLRLPGRDLRLVIAAVCFGLGIFAEYMALGGTDHDVFLTVGFFAFVGWAVLLYEVFFTMRSADAAKIE